ncbi:MAG: siphovirus ReqiPepy6 Gp37-like family protein, partial [Lachnospiraceae bacterium]|nr:siphovirus ReqiPepy6 Gp37-like family protein [Lachnospiraceae bacterium]
SNAKENYLLFTGRDCSCILEQRVIYPTMILKDKIENCIESILNDNIINPTNINRKIEFVEFNNSNAIDIDIDTQITGDNILKYMDDICNDYKIGYRVDFNKKTKKFILSLYNGADRTDISNNAVTFSKELGNVLKNDYMNDNTNYRNMGVIAGAGEGNERKVIYLNDELSGIDRRELFVDAKDLSTKDDEGHDIPEADYLNQLEQRGSEKLSESESQINNSIDIESNGQFAFNKDYFLGDIVRYKGYEESRERIVETIESVTESGTETELTVEEVKEDG